MRPTGVTIIAVLEVIGGLLSILGGVVLLALAPLWGILSLVLGIAAVILGIGLWRLRSWAWLGTLIVQGLNVLSGIINIINGGSVASQIIGLAINVIIIVYLLRPEIKAAFGR